MPRILLGDDGNWYSDGDISVPPIEIPGAAPSEIPYHDGRYIGRSLMVAADGSLVWVLNEGLPRSNGTQIGAVLTVGDGGAPSWEYASTGPGGLLDDEVISSDGTGLGFVYYGTGAPPPDAPYEGALWIGTRFTDASVPPSPPTTAPVLSAPVISGLKATLNWTVSVGANAYEVRADGTAVATVTGLSTTLTLAESSSHPIIIVPTNAGGVGPASNQVTATIANQVPPPVSGLDDTNIARGTVSVAWEYPSKPADFSTYVVTTSSGTLAVNQAAATATVTGLADSTNVTITVKAQDTGGLQSTAAQVVLRTPDAPVPSAPPTPTNLRATRIGYSSIDYAWNASSGATSYEWSGDGATYSNIGAGVTRSRTGLAESTTYKLYVRAVNAGGKSAAVSISSKTLPKVNHYTYTTRLRSFGYAQEHWNLTGIGHSQSGILSTVDNWANQSNPSNWLYAADYNINTGPYSSQAYRWINFSFTLNFIDVEQIYAWYGYPGTADWTAYDTDGTAVQQGRLASNTWPQWIPANVKNVPTNKRIAKIQMLFYAGLGSPGVYKLSEWAMQVRELTATTPVYNPA